ncbi:nuclear transport factor 2 family protein [Streptomyces sp. NPDC088147]|uniref:nuclear transport factor 2 family protein n=1 Tax=unclassified Streptomyces TaxID=2593676 RepID=UPI0033A15019
MDSTETVEGRTDFIDRGVETTKTRDVESYGKLLMDDLHYEDVTCGAEYQGKDAFLDYYRTWLRAFPDFEMKTLPSAITTEMAAVPWVITATYGDPLPGLPREIPRGSHVTLKGISTVVFGKGDSISAIKEYYAVAEVVPPAV